MIILKWINAPFPGFGYTKVVPGYNMCPSADIATEDIPTPTNAEPPVYTASSS